MQEFNSSGADPQLLAEQALDDVAVVTKVTNPWNSFNRVFILQGVRGIGTWGAGEFVKKHWKQLSARLSDKSGDFSVLVKIHYESCDIVHSEIHNLFEIPRLRS